MSRSGPRRGTGRWRRYPVLVLVAAVLFPAAGVTLAAWQASADTDPARIDFGTFQLTRDDGLPQVAVNGTPVTVTRDGEAITLPDYRVKARDQITVTWGFTVTSTASTVTELAAAYVPGNTSGDESITEAALQQWTSASIVGASVGDDGRTVRVSEGTGRLQAVVTITVPASLQVTQAGKTFRIGGTVRITQRTDAATRTEGPNLFPAGALDASYRFGNATPTVTVTAGTLRVTWDTRHPTNPSTGFGWEPTLPREELYGKNFVLRFQVRGNVVANISAYSEGAVTANRTPARTPVPGEWSTVTFTGTFTGPHPSLNTFRVGWLLDDHAAGASVEVRNPELRILEEE